MDESSVTLCVALPAPPKGLWTTALTPQMTTSDVLAVIKLRNRPDKEAFALLQQPFWLSAELGVLDCTAPTDEAGHGEKQKTGSWKQSMRLEVYQFKSRTRRPREVVSGGLGSSVGHKINLRGHEMIDNKEEKEDFCVKY